MFIDPKLMWASFSIIHDPGSKINYASSLSFYHPMSARFLDGSRKEAKRGMRKEMKDESLSLYHAVHPRGKEKNTALKIHVLWHEVAHPKSDNGRILLSQG